MLLSSIRGSRLVSLHWRKTNFWLFLLFSLVFQLKDYHGSFPPLKSRAVTWSYVTKCFVIPWMCWTIPASVYTARSAHISSFLQLEDILSLLWQYHNSPSPSGICILPSLWNTHSPLRTVLWRIFHCMRLIGIWTSKPAVLNLTDWTSHCTEDDIDLAIRVTIFWLPKKRTLGSPSGYLNDTQGLLKDAF